MQTRKPINIPVVSATKQEDSMAGSSCSGKDMLALMVLGTSMEPEFVEGEVLVIEPDLPAKDGSYVIGWLNDEYIFRQLQRDDQGGWRLHALNPVFPDAAISGLGDIRGVVTHKKKPGSRRSVKFYVEDHPGDVSVWQRN
jgi:DNA polymerase V